MADISQEVASVVTTGINESLKVIMGLVGQVLENLNLADSMNLDGMLDSAISNLEATQDTNNKEGTQKSDYSIDENSKTELNKDLTVESKMQDEKIQNSENESITIGVEIPKQSQEEYLLRLQKAGVSISGVQDKSSDSEKTTLYITCKTQDVAKIQQLSQKMNDEKTFAICKETVADLKKQNEALNNKINSLLKNPDLSQQEKNSLLEKQAMVKNNNELINKIEQQQQQIVERNKANQLSEQGVVNRQEVQEQLSNMNKTQNATISVEQSEQNTEIATTSEQNKVQEKADDFVLEQRDYKKLKSDVNVEKTKLLEEMDDLDSPGKKVAEAKLELMDKQLENYDKLEELTENIKNQQQNFDSNKLTSEAQTRTQEVMEEFKQEYKYQLQQEKELSEIGTTLSALSIISGPGNLTKEVSDQIKQELKISDSEEDKFSIDEVLEKLKEKNDREQREQSITKTKSYNDLVR